MGGDYVQHIDNEVIKGIPHVDGGWSYRLLLTYVDENVFPM